MGSRGLKILLACALGLAAAETLLHLDPRLLPRSYLARFPGNGTEFFHPDVFERTPVEGVLLPHRTSAHRGPPPADLVELGIASPTDDDARAFPEIELPVDGAGFNNSPVLPPTAHGLRDLLIVGDSFGVAAGVTQPEGLQAALRRTTGLSTYNVSVAGIGPVQERWLLELYVPGGGVGEVQPRAALWLYFSGNDLTESYEPFMARRDGRTTWAEAWPERRKPFLYLPGLFAELVRRDRASRPEPLPPFSFARADGGSRRIWFLPDHLRQLAWSADEWRAHPVWPPVQGELRDARDRCVREGVKLLFVYVPSAPEVLLPFVERDPDLVRRTIVALGAAAPPGTPEEILERLLANRRAQEDVVRDFCAAESIPFLSATPALEDLARRGELGYLTTDTHWNAAGQQALLEPLLAFLRAQGVIE